MTIRHKRYYSCGHRTAVCKRGENESVVKDGLAYSPADMARLTDRGIPVNSLAAAKTFYDGDTSDSFHVGAERERFVDVNDLWEKHVQLRAKAKKAALSKRVKPKSE